MCAIIQTPINQEKVEDILRNSVTLVAPAGYGKTMDIAKKMKADSLILSGTRGAKQRLEQLKGDSDMKQIMTVERAQMVAKDFGDVFIDEAN